MRHPAYAAVLATAALFASAAFAFEDPYSHLQGRALFDTLKERHASATLPGLDQREGWWAGRCVGGTFKKKMRKGYILTFSQHDSKLYFNTVLIEGENDPAAYEQLPPHYVAAIEDLIREREVHHIAPAFEKDGALVTHGDKHLYDKDHERFFVQYGVRHLKRSGDIYVQKIEFDGRGDWMCYFHKRVN